MVTGPSGAGKGTLIKELLGRRPELEVAVSATTRKRRPGEVDGKDYYFMSDEEFDAALEDGAFYEHVVYVSGQRYGTLEREIDRILEAGRSCVLEVETQGARAVKRRDGRAITIFIASPSFEELERRLRERATESAGEISERLALARRQMSESPDFDVVVVNDSIDRAADEIVEVADQHLKGG